MKKKTCSFALAICLVLSSFGTVSSYEGQTDFALEPFVQEQEEATRYIVSCYPGETLDTGLENELLDLLEVKEEISTEIQVIEFSEEEDIETTLRQIEEDPSVRFIEPDQERVLMGVGADPYYSQQWSLPNVEAPESWALAGALEKPITVAVIDSGVLPTHPDLLGRLLPGVSILNGVLGNEVADQKNHGTIVAGIIAAGTQNEIGIAGVAGGLDVSVLPINIFGAQNTANTSDLIAAIDHAIAAHVDVINLSLGGVSSSQAESEAIQRALNAGITVVAASGNLDIPVEAPSAVEAKPYMYPASYEGVISVGSIGQDNIRSSFSNYNDKVTVVAPGEAMVSTDSNGSYSTNHNGTSYSSPIVAAMVAVYKGEHPLSSPAEIKARLQATAIDAGVPGRDNLYGYGRVNFSDFLRADAFLDGSNGIIDALVIDRAGQKIITTMGGIDGYAYAAAAENQLYQYLSVSTGAISIYGIRSGTKYMKLEGTDGYAENHAVYATAGKAMISTPALGQDEIETFFIFAGFDGSGEAILTPYPLPPAGLDVRENSSLKELLGSRKGNDDGRKKLR